MVVYREIRLESSGTRRFGSSQQKISGSNGTSEKVVPFFSADGKLQTEIRVPFLQSHSQVNGTDLNKWLTRFRDEIYQSRTFQTIYPNRELTRGLPEASGLFTHVPRKSVWKVKSTVKGIRIFPADSGGTFSGARDF